MRHMHAHSDTCDCQKQRSEALARLEQWRLRTNERDKLIRDAYTAGARQIDIANAAKISRLTVARTIEKGKPCQK